MENIIYSISPLRAFAGGLFLIGFMLVLGVAGAFWAIFGRREKPLARIGMGFSSIILLLATVAMVVSMILTIQGGDKTVSVRVNEKKEVVSNCDNGGSCTSYLLETQTGQKNYDFTVAKRAWDIAEVNACYSFTYYPSTSLFGKYLQEQDISEFYESASTITQIVKVACRKPDI